jgi:two-component system NtrC family sensor kinase
VRPAPLTSTSSAWFRSHFTRSSTPPSWTRSTGPSSGQRAGRVAAAGALPSFCAQFSLRSGSKKSAAAGCCRWFTRRARDCSACGSGPSKQGRPTGLLLHRLDQTATAYDAIFYVLAALLFLRSYSRADTPLLRQQLKWVTRGTLLAVVLPFHAVLRHPFLSTCIRPGLLTNLAGLSLVFLPLTFSWAIVRYRLMDTDLIFKRGVAYTLATGLLLGGYFGIIALITLMVHNPMPDNVREWGLVLAILVTAAIFDPLKRKIQGWVDRAFDRHRYDYRKALIEFGRGLSSETDLQALLESIVERLPRTLLVARVAVFLAQDTEDSGGLRLAAAHGLPAEVKRRAGPAGARLPRLRPGGKTTPTSFLKTLSCLHLPADQQRTAALLDLNYYLPCRVAAGQLEDGTHPAASRTIAVIGLGRTIGGDFLSSEDVELLESLASYIGIALQNASLYARLEKKIGEFERLKEFNENIVESINVGILAIDLDDRIESWNAQMEAMYALSRAEAIGQPLQDVFPRVHRGAGRLPQRAGRASPLQVPSDHPRRRAAHRQYRHRAPALARLCLRGPHRPGGRHHRAGLA